MINVVLKTKEHVSFFASELSATNIKFDQKLARIFVVYCERSDFDFGKYDFIKSVSEPKQIGIQEPMLDVTDTNIIIERFPELGEAAQSWGPHRLLRRKNPLLKETNTFDKTFSLPRKQVRTGLGVDIYVLDDGINCSLPEFGGRCRRMSTDDNTYVEYSTEAPLYVHATHVTACAIGNTVGMAPGANAYYHRMYTGSAGNDTDYIAILDDVYQHYISRSATNRPAIINWSWGALLTDLEQTQVAYEAFQDIMEAGIIICAAAGNRDWNLNDCYVVPAEVHPDIVLVGAIRPHDFPMFTRAGPLGGLVGNGTSVGPSIDLFAPGTSIIVPEYGAPNEYTVTGGTSFACPYTVGVLACMLEGYQRLNSLYQVQSVVQRLIDNSTKGAIRFINDFHFGPINNNRIPYLDPFKTIEGIPELTPL